LYLNIPSLVNVGSPHFFFPHYPKIILFLYLLMIICIYKLIRI